MNSCGGGIVNKILIIGAGGHGQVIAEIAKDLGYGKIAFADDKSPIAIAKICEIDRLMDDYKDAFIGIGDNRLREALISKLLSYGYSIPALIHPTAYISRTASIGIGTVVEPKAVVNANTVIGQGSIISVGAIVDHDVIVGEYCHINAGAIVKAGAVLESYRKLEAGEVVKGY